MDLYKEILVNFLVERCAYPEKGLDAKELLSLECYQLIEKIRDILADDTMNDPECYRKIEALVTLYDHLGGCGNRHDF